MTKSTLKVSWLKLIIIVVIATILWVIPIPKGLTPQAWHIAIIFVSTIVGAIFRVLPMSGVALLGMMAAIVTGTLSHSPKTSVVIALSGFTSTVTWLVVFAFLIGRGFIKTGLGSRIAYLFIRMFGKKTLGLSYSLAVTDLILAPGMPSITARGGGIITPILRGISEALGSYGTDNSRGKIGGYLFSTAAQINVVTAFMFLTAMAGNPVIAGIAQGLGYNVTWGTWFLGAIVPGIVCIVMVPLVMYWIYPPQIKHTPKAREFAESKLREMGPMSLHEKIMLVVFVLLLVLWVTGSLFHYMHPVTGAMIGVSILLMTQVLSVKEFFEEKAAWDTFFWMSIFIMLGNILRKSGFTTWIAMQLNDVFIGISPLMLLLVFMLVYMYVHYFFASASAQAIALYAIFVTTLTAVGLPGIVVALIFAYLSNLYGSLTQYGIGSAPIFFGTGYVPLSHWWRNGFIISILNIIILLSVGGLWWKILGWW